MWSSCGTNSCTTWRQYHIQRIQVNVTRQSEDDWGHSIESCCKGPPRLCLVTSRTSNGRIKLNNPLNTGLFEVTVGVLTTCHTQYTRDRSICVFFFYLIEQHSKFFYIPCRCSICAPFVILQTLTRQSSSFQTVRSMSAVMVSMAVLIRTFSLCSSSSRKYPRI